MRVSESWLREWVDPDLDTDALGHALTMLGHEVEAIATEGVGIEGVLVAEVVAVGKHPNADRLSVCKVSGGSGKPVEVVCGAPNVRKGMRSPFASPGMRLPNGIKLRKSKIRGVVSNGMLCSAIELGLGEESDGIIELPADAPVGTPLVEYLGLPDAVFDIDLTPNRGDCFCVLGIAREVSSLTGAKLDIPRIDAVTATNSATQAVELVEPAGCPVFAGRVVRGIDAGARSPLWLVERLRRAGLRAIHPVVDVTNYVMLELGQPLHAYDLDRLQGAIRPRLARTGESVTLLDGRELEVNEDTLVIADESGAIGLAGIMGGLSTAVSDTTTNVFFEAAFWPQDFMAGRARSYGMHTDASMRFERGVDPEGQGRAVERATALLLDIAGGDAGPLVVTRAEEHLPVRPEIRLRRARLARLLGTEIDADAVTDILGRLGLEAKADREGWTVTVPSHRFDLTIEADLIEEVARIHGYDRIPETTAIAETPLVTLTERAVDPELAAATLVARDYREVVTFSFIDAGADEAMTAANPQLVLSNPISSEMSVMRSSLWPGLLEVAARNLSRQQERVRIFEIGKSFHGTLDDPREVLRIAGLACGPVMPESWSAETRPVDLFDIKSDIDAMLGLAGRRQAIIYEAAEHPALQPGQVATIARDGDAFGIFGKLHPRLQTKFGLKAAAYLFELDAEKALSAAVPKARPISKFPQIRRDIAVVVDDSVSVNELVQAVQSTAPALVTDAVIFDIYAGPGIEAGRKSVAIGLILQETSRTLTDDDADAVQAAAVQKLQQEFAAVLRD